MSVTLMELRAASRALRGAKMTWIYFIQVGDDGPIKIGIAKNPRDRLSTLQTAHAERLHLLAVWRAPVEIEKQLHEQFRAHWIGREWFHPHPDILAEAKACAETHYLELREFRGEDDPTPWPIEVDL